jgi:hypothetical protein
MSIMYNIILIITKLPKRGHKLQKTEIQKTKQSKTEKTNKANQKKSNFK